MTINKAQGQTLCEIGIQLAKHVFSHGQLYVAFVRFRQFDAISFSLTKNITKKILYMTVLFMTEVLTLP